MEDKIIEVINKIRPFLQKDGGDMEFVRFEDGIVYIRILGACVDCALIDTDINDGIEAMLIDEVPGVIGVQVVKE